MRRPHVYERSVPRARRDFEQEGGADYVPAAHALLAAVPALLREAEAAGAVTLARFLGQALTEAERIVRRAREIRGTSTDARMPSDFHRLTRG